MVRNKYFLFKKRVILEEAEMVVANNGCTFDKFVSPDTVRDAGKKTYSRLCAQHGSCSNRKKSFGLSKNASRHRLSPHLIVFHAGSKLIAPTSETKAPLSVSWIISYC